MNCSTFHRRVNDLLEDDCLIEFKNSMEEHIDSCKGCKAYYEKELEMDKNFKEFFSVKDIEFKSSRTEIINGINKNKYKNNYFIGIYTHFNKHKKKYISWAAVFFMIFLVVPNISKLFEVDKINFRSSKSASTVTASINKDSSQDKSQENALTINNITFEKLALTGDEKIIPRDTWKTSGDGKYSACIDGKTANSTFGIRNIYVKDNNTGQLWSFTIKNNSNGQSTPMFLEWSQKNEALMVIIGKTTEAVVEGGDIYTLNLDSAIATLIYKPAELEKIKSFESLNGDLKAQLVVYEDSNFTKYHVENIKISAERINNMLLSMRTLSKEASIVFEYQENINNNRLEAAIKLISKKHIDSKVFNYKELLYDVDSMDVASLKKITSAYDIDQITKTSFQHEAFLAEVYYKLKKDENAKIKSGRNSVVIVLVKDNANSSWQIGEMKVIK